MSKDIIYPGYFISGIIEFQDHHPLTAWWLGIIGQIKDHANLVEFKQSATMSLPDEFRREEILNYFLQSLLSHNVIRIDWRSGKISLSKNYKKWFENGIMGQKMYETRKVEMEWWIDGLGGEILSVLMATKYDWNYSDQLTKDTERIERNEPLEILTNRKYDIRDLLVQTHKSYFRTGRKSAFIRSQLIPTGEKDIRFKLIQSGTKHLLPYDLGVLENSILSEKPELIQAKHKKTKKKLQIESSPLVELYHSLREAFGDFSTIDKDLTRHALKYVDYILDKKERIIDYYNSSKVINQISGGSDLFFNNLDQFLQSKDKVTVIATSSFLNPYNLKDGLDISLRENPDADLIIIYGHANDDTPTQHQDKIDDYLNELEQLVPDTRDRVTIIPALNNSHEKILISSEGRWMISSWNLTSSIPGGTMLETGVYGQDREIASQLLRKIEPLIESEEVIRSFKSQITTADIDKIVVEHHLEILLAKVEDLRKIQMYEKYWELINYVNTLNSVINALIPFLRRSKIEFIETDYSRELLLRLINRAKSSIFLASDRVSSSALDHGLIRDLQALGKQGKRSVAILWGREFEKETSISRENRKQLQEAGQILKRIENAEIPLFTQDRPMENHGKFVIIDETKCFLTSENILNYGGEKTETESRELGIYFEAPVASVQLLSNAVLHRQPVFETFSKYGSEWFYFGSELYYAFEQLDELDMDFSDPALITSAIIDELNQEQELQFDQDLYDQMKENFQNYLDLYQSTFMERGFISLGIFSNPDYRWLPIDTKQAVKYSFTLQEKSGVENDEVKNDPIIEDVMKDMIWIKPGTFKMGSHKFYKEKPPHQVKISRGYWMSKYIVTQELYERVMGGLPSASRKNLINPDFPVFFVTYHDMMEFINKLNQLPGGGGFDLPTEAEWEYACRAGTKGDYFFGDVSKIDKFAWSKKNSNKKPHPVGTMNPNPWGLYDMLGLAYENVKDEMRDYRKSKGVVVDPIGSLNSEWCGARGGSWGKWPFAKGGNDHFRCASRPYNLKTEKSHRLSFRLIRRK